MPKTEIKINLYDEQDEVINTLVRKRIPWGLLKKIVKRFAAVEDDEGGEASLENIAEVVCEIFKDKVTVEELDEQGDVGEIIDVFQTIVELASPSGPNLIPPVK